MVWVDWVIVIVMVVSMTSGLAQGFFRSAFGLAGLLVGLGVASWNYGRVSAMLMPLFRVKAVSDAVSFLLIAMLVLAIFAIIGAILAKALKLVGLGCLDAFGGIIFGFFQGVILVTLGILAIVAFFPSESWLAEARLPKMFFGACHLSMHASPEELEHRVRDGLKVLEKDTNVFIAPKKS